MNFVKFVTILLLTSSMLFSVDNYYGEKFIFSIPYNEDPEFANFRKEDNVIELNISAEEDAIVQIYRNDGNILIGEYFVAAGDSEALNYDDFIDNQIAEYGVGDYQTEKTYTIISDSPITANLVNYFLYSSEAMTLIPVSSWGYEYSHISYWNSVTGNGSAARNRSTGFIILASEDDTEIEIELNGKNRTNNYQINEQYKLDDRFKITLDKNSSYNIEARGLDNTIDITGSFIKSDKKIAVISYHQRTGVFANYTLGRDYLLEMYPSIDTWGKEFVTMAYERKNFGDYYRIVASEDNTEIELTSFDSDSKDIIETRTITLDRFEFYETEEASSGIDGITHWKSNNPIILAQFAFSAEIDGTTEFDPTMVYISPIKQYDNQIYFKTPLVDIFEVNKISLIVNNINSDENDLENVIYNGTPIYLLDQDFLDNQIPGTNFYYSTIDVNNFESNSINSDVPFYGVLFGNKEYDSYAITVGGEFKNLNLVDTIAPIINFSQSCRDFIISSSEINLVSNSIDTLNNFQSGLKNLEINSLENFLISNKSGAEVSLEVKDLRANASAVITSTDLEGNFTTDTINYTPNFNEIEIEKYWVNKRYSPGEIIEFDLSSFDTPELSLEDSIYIEISHPEKALFLMDREYLSKIRNINDTLIYTFNITGLLNSTSENLIIKFQALLWEQYSFDLSFRSSESSECNLILPEDIRIEFDECLYEYRNVQGSAYGNALRLDVQNESINLEFISPYEQNFQLKIVDLLGNLIYKREYSAIEGINNYSVNNLELENGTYFVRLDGETFTILGKFIYQ